MARMLARSFARVALATTVLFGAACSSPPKRALAPVTAGRAPATAPLTVPADTLASWIDAYASGFGKEWGPAFAPTGYLLVAKDGVPIVSRAYGTANPKTGAAIGPSTQLALGSVTKQFTAVAVLQLAEKKRVNLTDSVRAHVAELPHEFDDVTLHHLLTHTSGIANYTADPELMASTDEHLPRARVVASFAQKPLAFRPGAKFEYSNSNYFLLGLVIEKASGRTYEEYLQANVLGPANMLRTTTAFDAHTFDAALGTAVDDHEKISVVHVWDTPLPFAAGALRSTAIDMLAWDRALTTGKLLNAESERLRTTPEKEDYACGVDVAMQAGYRVESHGGRIDGFRSFFARVPAIGVAVVFLSNSQDFDASAFGGAVTKMLVEAKSHPPKSERAIGPLDAALAAQLAGSYELVPTSRERLAEKVPAAILDSIAKMTVTVEGSHIVVKANGQPPFTAFPARDARSFFTKTSGIDLVPAVSPEGGQVTGFGIQQAGLAFDFARATPGT
jgi:CubicO group peptidase (beta-lactamase class C family)